MSPAEWQALSWDIQRAYLEGMEKDESVPLTFERQEGDELTPGVPDGAVKRRVEAASVIDLEAMIEGFSQSRPGGG